MSKKCTPLWREAHFQVKTHKAHHFRTTRDSAPFQKWAKREGFVAVSTTTTTTLHYTTLRSTTTTTTLHYATIHYTPLHSTTQHYTQLHYTTLHFTTLNYTTVQLQLHYITLHYTTLHSITPPTCNHFPAGPIHYTTLITNATATTLH